MTREEMRREAQHLLLVTPSVAYLDRLEAIQVLATLEVADAVDRLREHTPGHRPAGLGPM